jgi:hypothetical protein
MVQIDGHFDPEPRVTDRRGLFFAGILFAEGGYRDRQALETGHDIMIHSIEPGSEADGSELWNYDFIAKVNGIDIENLDHLQNLLAESEEQAGVEIDFLRFVEDSETGHLFYSLRRDFSWSAPTKIGGW